MIYVVKNVNFMYNLCTGDVYGFVRVWIYHVAYLGCSSKKAEANNRKPKLFLRSLRIASVPTKMFAVCLRHLHGSESKRSYMCRQAFIRLFIVSM